jgi:hypothetical protein
MIEIGGKPILWHIMKIYSAHGINDFVICCGYKGYVIKEYFANYFLHMSDVTFDLRGGGRRRVEEAEDERVDQGLPRRFDDVLAHPDGRPGAVAVGRVDEHPHDRAGGRPSRAVDDPTALLPVLDADVVHPVGPAHPPYEYSGVFTG